MLTKILLCLLISTVLADKCNITTTNFLSPHSLGKQDEMTDALAVLCRQVRINTTLYEFGRTNYSLYNFKLGCVYNDGRQVADITEQNHIKVSGGKIQFTMYFNYTVSRIGPDKPGWAYASVFTDPITFAKEMMIDEGGHPIWTLTKNLTPPIHITDPLVVKRFEPKPTEDDITAINQALSSAISAITPKNVKQQISDLINENYTSVLNQTLREQKVFTNTINYTFHHAHKGQLSVKLINQHYSHTISPEEGFELYYLTLIEGWNASDCRYNLPVQHKNYSSYGGIQSYISLDLVRHLAQYNLQKRWLDTLLDGGDWETDAFQFYAGDLYDIIDTTQSLAPRTRISGGCNGQDDSYFDLRRFNYESIRLNVNYSCVLETSDSGRIRLVQFSLPIIFYLKMTLEYETLEVTVAGAVSESPQFHPVGKYVVTDPNLAKFKINMALKSLIGQRVFGSGFPTWPRDVPEVEVDASGEYLVLYDNSQVPHFQPS